MVAAFDQARVEIEVKDVLIGGGIAEEDSAKVVAIQLTATVACAFNADSGPKQFEVGEVRFEAIISLKWCFPSFGVDEPIVEVDRV